MSAKIATLGILKKNFFWKKGYEVIISVHDVTNKILSRDSNYIVNVIMWLKFGNSSILWEKLSYLQFYKDLTRKIIFSERKSWFKLSNLRLALDMALKFYTSLAIGLKLKVKTFWRLIPTFVEVTGERLEGGLFLPPHPE